MSCVAKSRRSAFTTTGLHRGERLERAVEVDGIKDTEDLLADFVAESGAPPQHLLIKNAAPDPTQEHEVHNRRHVDAGGEEIDGDGDARLPLVLVPAQQLAGGLSDAPVIFTTAASSTPPYWASRRASSSFTLLDVRVLVGGGRK